MPQFFAPPHVVEAATTERLTAAVETAATPGTPARDAVSSAHLALIGVPDLRSLDDVLTWMSRELVARFGFDRVMALRADAHRLTIAEVAYSGQHELAREAQHNAERHPVELRATSLEVDMIRRRAPALVVPTGDPRAWHPITDQLATSAYVAAPVEAFGRTVATLHADSHFAGREVDAHDRAALGLFVRVSVSVVERALLFEEIDRLHGSIRSNAEQLLALTDQDPTAEPWHREPTAPTAPPPPAAHPALTPRENEVLALMSRGATSQDIARRLVLSAGTVKTHARNILRKLGASTRAEAVARALEQQPLGRS